MRPTRRIAVLGATLTLAVTLTACASDTTPPAESPAEASAPALSDDAADQTAHNDTDAQFAQMMIVHHEGAIEMAELAVTSAATDEVRSLGERIAGAQGPEIQLMTSWLEAWEEELPSDADMSPMDHGSMEMDGMDQEQVMAELSGLTGTDFDRRFLELMTDHHRGAIEMAEEHREQGANPEAISLSGQIIDAQTAEITEMTNLLQAL